MIEGTLEDQGLGLNTVSVTGSWLANTISVLTAGAVGQARDGTPDADCAARFDCGWHRACFGA